MNKQEDKINYLGQDVFNQTENVIVLQSKCYAGIFFFVA